MISTQIYQKQRYSLDQYQQTHLGKQYIFEIKMRQRVWKSPCYNGPNCQYLARGNCRYYHPAQHFRQNSQQSNRGYGRNQYSTQQSFVQRRFNESQSGNSNRHRSARQEPRVNRSQDRYVQMMQNLRQSFLQQTQQLNGLMRNISAEYVGRLSEDGFIIYRPRPQQHRTSSFMDRLHQSMKQNENEFQNFDWFFDKNKVINPEDLTEQQKEACAQCSICYETFDKEPEKQVKEQTKLDLSENTLNDAMFENKTQQDIAKMLEHISYQKQKEVELRQQKQRQNQKNKVEVVQLFCNHMFHKQCIKQWLVRNPKCAICRKEFYDHESYSKYDPKYKQRFAKKSILNMSTQEFINTYGLEVDEDDDPFQQFFEDSDEEFWPQHYWPYSTYDD